MRPSNFFTTLLLLSLLSMASCKKDSTDANTPVLSLTPDNVTGKSGRTIEAKLSIYAPNGAGKVKMYKTINLQRDNSFGNAGILEVTPVNLGENNYEYVFSYQLAADEVDKLVGINFRFEDSKGIGAEKDLTINTTTSGQQIMYSRRWKLISRMWTSVTPAVEDMKDCERDNTYIWKADSTYNVLFGTNPCTFDGFNVFDKWELSEDEKTLKQEYHSLFDPSNRTVETYTVLTLTRDKIVLQQLIDLTVFGLTDKEVFISTFEPIP
ncbi:hypothetical protein JMG10_14605 [Nostoc ellipsosporum NOK]|jgi:hypothetical protein|nr:hypothetical protein [Nostoc ellipsosporum NOK]